MLFCGLSQSAVRRFAASWTASILPHLRFYRSILQDNRRNDNSDFLEQSEFFDPADTGCLVGMIIGPAGPMILSMVEFMLLMKETD